jgi:ApaG protein
MDSENTFLNDLHELFDQKSPAVKAPLIIKVEVDYQDVRSKIGEYVFSYRIKIENIGSVGVQIIARHWRVLDCEQNIQEVRGLGIVGEQPLIQAGKSHEYSSFSIIQTPTGAMQGYFLCISENAEFMIAEVPAFNLAPQYILH